MAVVLFYSSADGRYIIIQCESKDYKVYILFMWACGHMLSRCTGVDAYMHTCLVLYCMQENN